MVTLDTGERATADESTLVRQAQRGDRTAFATLVEGYYERLHRWLYQLTHDRHSAEDLTQESFLKAFANLHRFQAGSNFRAWLFRIAHNTFLNQRRAASRQTDPLPTDVKGAEEGPVELLLQKEAIAHLTRAVGRLPADFRAALLLRVEEEMSFRQIADVLNITEETARWRVFKARQKLLRVLGDSLDEEKP